jgi:hypothetical protein
MALMAKKAKSAVEDNALPSLALVFGYIAIKDLQRLEDRVRVLSQLGYGNQEIARICDTTPGTVGVQKANIKQKKARRRR